jgi:hypothetical protein
VLRFVRNKFFVVEKWTPLLILYSFCTSYPYDASARDFFAWKSINSLCRDAEIAAV